MVGFGFRLSVKCAGCGRERSLDGLYRASEHRIAEAKGVQVHRLDQEHRCQQCGDQRVIVRFGFGGRLPRAAAREPGRER